MASDTQPKAGLGVGPRPRWAAPDRAAHYRDQAAQFQRMAEQESELAARARLLELARQYEGLASKLAPEPDDNPRS